MKIAPGWPKVDNTSVVDYNYEFNTSFIVAGACGAELYFTGAIKHVMDSDHKGT